MAGTVLKYGDYEHPENEVNLVRFECIQLRSPRNKQIAKLYRMYVSGEIQADTFQGIYDRVQELIETYYYERKGAVSYWINGVKTQHGLLNDAAQGSMTGVRIINRSWPHGRPSEWVNARNFSITFEEIVAIASGVNEAGEANPDADAQTLKWSEQIYWQGTTGPYWRYRVTQNGMQRETIFPRMPMRLIQVGDNIGYQGYVVPPGPILGTDFEHGESRVVVPGTPVWQGLQNGYFPFSWRYEFEVPDYIEKLPLPREQVVPF